MSPHACEHDACHDTDTTPCIGCWRWLCECHRGTCHICPPCAEKLTCCGCAGEGCTTCALWPERAEPAA
jgi:hypothetical protein